MAAYFGMDNNFISNMRAAAERLRDTTGTAPVKGQSSFNTSVSSEYTNGQQDIRNQLADQYSLLADRAEYNNTLNGIFDYRSKDTIGPSMRIQELSNKLNAAGSVLSASATQADQALQSQAQSDSATAKGNTTANINAGINKSRAGMLGSQKASTDTSVAQSSYQANRSNAASTQADYLEKMAQADALDQQAENMRKSSGLLTLSAAFNGLGAGAGAGAALGGAISDENAKEEPTDGIDTDELLSSMYKFIELYKKVKEMK